MKKLVALLLSCTMATSVALVGCGNDAASETTTESEVGEEGTDENELSENGTDETVSDVYWPSSYIASLVPVPETGDVEIQYDSEDYFWAIVYNVSENDMNEYVEKCKEAGFTLNYLYSNGVFVADNEDGYSIDMIYFEPDEYSDPEEDVPFYYITLYAPGEEDESDVSVRE